MWSVIEISGPLPYRSGPVRSAVKRPAADSPPGQPGHQLLGLLLGDPAVTAEPVPRADLRRPDHAHREHVRGVVRDTGVFLDELADHPRALLDRPVEPDADRGLVAQVGLENQPEGPARPGHEA